ncbi:hypothetical protein DPMN_160321 [Dreissena polymorpha]|uniref:Uncharacterized protein n=1 Tax=Dreissena polymorpha TaxID=45954 RepID=A0A9D4INN2_DREPO|nr:hypothetical protein DPMN_160321 [Dreissena polymorpha]
MEEHANDDVIEYVRDASTDSKEQQSGIKSDQEDSDADTDNDYDDDCYDYARQAYRYGDANEHSRGHQVLDQNSKKNLHWNQKKVLGISMKSMIISLQTFRL